jgi:hypothetical protein
MRVFSMGALYAVPNAANPTPVPIASLKDCSVEFKQAKKQFRGNQRGVLDVGDGALDITFKIKNADFRGSALSLVVPGATSATTGLQVATGEAGTIPTTPFQVTVANSAQFSEDGGVLDLTTGKWMNRGATSTATQVYAVAAGIYTFNTADTGHLVSIVYSYTVASGVVTMTYNNTIQSQSVPFKLRVYNPYTLNGASKLVGFDFQSAHFEKLSGAFKVEDFAEHDLEGFASQDMIGSTALIFKEYVGE